MNLSLGKANKLCSPKIIDEVFESGMQVKSYPFVLKFKETTLPKDVSFQIVFSAPKRTFRKAFQRNRIKRLCKEAFRSKRSLLDTYLEKQNKQLALFLVYTPKEELSLSLLNGRTEKLIKKIISQLESNDVKN
ncbi:MAG: ribonuclease P protein component [Crocinitomicaceae bacterium]|nr:ribonuclease P protein component [Crocinitomicaceae bacterium]